jgi:type IV protein arginine methyltransferase
MQAESILLDWAATCEQLLSAQPQVHLEEESLDYLGQSVSYQGGNLMDANGEAVMMEWEKPLMLAHANLICQSGGDVLNVGFGLGLVDEAIQQCAPRGHSAVLADTGFQHR